jgi:hypothetical protein
VNRLKISPKQIFLNTLSPVLVILGTLGGIGRYGYMDDYSILESSISGKFNLELSLSQGRPFSGIYSYLTFSLIDSIDQLMYLHILGTLTLSIFSFLTFRYFYTTTNNYLISTTLAVTSILLSPGLLLIVGWSVMSSSGISIIPAVIAAFLIRLRNRRYFIVIQVLLTISFLSYPPATSIFLALPCIAWILSHLNFSRSRSPNNLLRNFLDSFLHFTLSGAISLFLLKTIASRYSQQNDRTKLFGDIGQKLHFIFKDAIPAALDFASPKWGFSEFGWCMTSSIFILIFIFTQKSKLQLFAVVFLLGVSSTFIPIVLTAENWASNRTLMMSQWLLASLFVSALLFLIEKVGNSKVRQRLIEGSLIMLIIVSISSSNTILNSAIRAPQQKELQLARRAISELNPNKKIEVRKSSWTDTVASWVAGDEFGLPSSCQTWVPVPMTKLIFAEINSNKKVEVVLVEKFQTANRLDFARILNPD